MNLKLAYQLNEIHIDKTQTPAWAEKVKRWSQLDEASFVLAEAVFKNVNFLSQDFDQVVLLSTQASNSTDHLFVTDTKISPSHFVHTLPNVRAILFSTLLEWEGQMFCLSQGKYSLVTFLKEITIAHADKKTMIVNLNKKADLFHCDFYLVGVENKKANYVFMDTNIKNEDHEYNMDDFAFREQLANQSEIFLTKNVGIRKVNQ